MAPGAFLYNAERFDLIGGIDRWVLGQAVQLLHEQASAGNDISLVGQPVGQDDERPVDRRGPCRADGGSPRSAAAGSSSRSPRRRRSSTSTAPRELARDLRSLGCHFALDDFGSGFASFYYLKHLQFDFLKIDGEFISKLIETPADQLVVRAVVDIARGLGTKTIAEFVADDDTVELLHELGVDYGQGYHLGRPAPLSDRLPTLVRPSRGWMRIRTD